MKKTLIVAVCVMVVFGSAAQVSMQEKKERGTYNAVARMKVILRCVDQDGHALPDVTVSTGVTLDGNPETTTQINGKTDKDGCFVVAGSSNGDLGYRCRKEGYYDTREVKHLGDFPEVYVFRDLWQPYGMTNTVVLKRKINPVAMHVRRGALNRLALPRLEDWTAFDLEHSDWIQPHGKGEREDFQVLFRRGDTNHMGVFRQYSLTFRFCKPFDGVYRAQKDNTGSQFRCTYEADTNHIYMTEIQFCYERLDDPASGRAIYKNKLLGEDEYLVLRVRSETDAEGRPTKANYAKICTPLFAAHYGFQITTYYNPETNNTSLEADTTQNLLNPNDLGFAP